MNRALFDTHLLLWFGARPDRLPRKAANLMSDRANAGLFSAVSVAEVAIKFAKGRPDFQTHPDDFVRDLVAAGFEQLPLLGRHAARLVSLPARHGDPFDRLMIAQALAEGIAFVTADAALAGYPGQITLV